MPIVVVCLSGGLHSCVTAAIAGEDHELALLHANYGQKTERRELRSFREIGDFYDVRERLVVDMGFFGEIGGSSLIDARRDVPAGDLARSGIPTTYVPFRNANILSAGVSWAETIGARAVYLGAVEEDSSGYPDCRRAFFDAFNSAVSLGTRPESEITVETPVIEMSKAQIVKRGIELGAPLQMTWSCYRDEEIACGTCDSCLLRLRAFADAEVTDPISYSENV